jgi:endonuclease YncB( thermonuclease family)
MTPRPSVRERAARILLAIPLLVATLARALATTLRGEVIGIADGDTLTLLTPERQQVRIRLAEVDTPERRQPWGNRARQALAELVFRRPVAVEVVDVDRYGRTVGWVFRGRLNINAEMIRQGHAWVYRRYLQDPTLLRLEAEARRQRRGLWSLPEAQRVPPWEWRREAAGR